MVESEDIYHRSLTASARPPGPVTAASYSSALKAVLEAFCYQQEIVLVVYVMPAQWCLEFNLIYA